MVKNNKSENKKTNVDENKIDSIENEIEIINKYEEVLKEKELLERKVKDLEQIASNSQTQYVLIKNDFDSFIRRTEDLKKTLKDEVFIENMKKLIPMVEELRKTIENTPPDLLDNARVWWLEVLYKSFLSKLESMWVSQVLSVGLDLDENLHEPIWSEHSDDLKWKVIKEFERLYVYKKWDVERIIVPAKVIVWV